LLAILDLRSDHRLLDVGAGHGWPGWLLAESSGCRLTSTDIPVNALAWARQGFVERGLGERGEVLAADVVALPFRDRSFDAVTHADVFC
jgi:cyclopropane fatty-acyl-phospholipid synthase-like methyltransferase